MNTVAYLTGYGALTAAIAPRLLTAPAGPGRAPRLGITGWFVAANTVVLLWAAAVTTAFGHPNPIVRAVAAVAVGAFGGRLLWTVCTGVSQSRLRRRDGLAVLGVGDECTT